MQWTLDNTSSVHYSIHMNDQDEIDLRLLENWEEQNNLNEWFD